MMRLGRARTSLLLVVLSAALLGLSRLPWLKVSLDGVVRKDVLTAGAPDLAPIVPAAALVGLAAAAALSIAGPAARRVVLALATIAGVMAAVGCVMVLRNPDAGVRAMLGGRVIMAMTAHLTPVVWICLGDALAMIAISVLAQREARGWAGRRTVGSRFERAADAAPERSSAGDWDALSRGEDPTR